MYERGEAAAGVSRALPAASVRGAGPWPILEAAAAAAAAAAMTTGFVLQGNDPKPEDGRLQKRSGSELWLGHARIAEGGDFFGLGFGVLGCVLRGEGFVFRV